MNKILGEKEQDRIVPAPATTEDHKLVWSKPTVRIMTVDFTRSGSDPKVGEGVVVEYSPPI